eukprot:scaffold13078_cov118-Isochrysis_galbana.AAC.1
MVAAANDVLAAAGAVEHVNRLGDRLAREHTTRHNQILNRWCLGCSAGSCAGPCGPAQAQGGPLAQ